MMHRSVPGVSTGSADPTETIKEMNDLVVQFFDAYLKGEGSFTASGTY